MNELETEGLPSLPRVLSRVEDLVIGRHRQVMEVDSSYCLGFVTDVLRCPLCFLFGKMYKQTYEMNKLCGVLITVFFIGLKFKIESPFL